MRIQRHYWLIVLCAAFVALSIQSCDKNLEERGTEIKISEDDLSEISLGKATTRVIILKGGNGKYSASVADSRIATVKTSMDTLRVTGNWVGETYATIISGDYKKRLDIRVATPDLNLSAEEIHLFPRDESKFLHVAGGGEDTQLRLDDPDNILEVKWNGATGIMEINALAEGDARITVVPASGEERSVKVLVRCNGKAEDVGVYGTTSRSLFRVMNTVMSVHRPGIGVWLVNNVNPYSTPKVLKIAPEVKSPETGQQVALEITMRDAQVFENSDLEEGKQLFVVEEVREREVVLRGKRVKLVLPYAP